MGDQILITTAGGQIYLWDPVTDAVSLIADTGLALTDIAVDANNQIYVVTSDAFYRIDESTGNAEFLFELDLSLYQFFTPQISGFTISSDGFGLITFQGSNPIVEVNLSTGVQRQVGLFGNQVAPGSGDIAAFDFGGETFFFSAEANTFAFLNDNFQEIEDRFFSVSLEGIVAAPLGSSIFTPVGNFTSGFGFDIQLVGFSGTSAHDLGNPASAFAPIRDFDFSSAITGAASYVSDGNATAPDDDFAADPSTTGVVILGEPSSGVLEQGSDEDWFRVTLVAGVRYTFTQSSAGENPISSPFLNLFDDQSQPVVPETFQDAANSSSIVYTAEYTGTYFLSAASFDGAVTGTYSLAFQAAPDAPDTGALTLALEGGEFSFGVVDGVQTGTGSGTTLIGVTASPTLLRATGSETWFTSTSASITADAFIPGIGGVNSSLFAGALDIEVATLRGTITNSGPAAFSFGGFEVFFTEVAFSPNALSFDASIVLDNGRSGIPIQFDDALILDENGFRFGVTGTLNLPDFNLAVGETGSVTVTDASVQYRGVQDEIRAQGQITASIGGNGVTFDLTGDNFIAWGGTRPDGSPRTGGWDLVGEARFEGNIPFLRGWGLNGASLSLDTETETFGISATLYTPFGLTINPVEATISGTFAYDPFELDSIRFAIDNLNTPFGTTPLFLQGGFLELSNLVGSNAATVTIGLDATLLPATGGAEVTRFEGQLSGAISSPMLSGQLAVTYLPIDINLLGISIEGAIGSSTGSVEYNFVTETLTLDGTHRFLGGLIEIDQALVFDSNFNFSLSDQLAINLPDTSPFLSGAAVQADVAVRFTNDDNSANDYVAFWATSRATLTAGVGSVQTSFDIQFEIGRRVAFDGTITTIGGDAINAGASQQATAALGADTALTEVAQGTEYLILSASWDNADPDAQLVITLPNGIQITETEFAANSIVIVEDLSNDFSRVAFAFRPQAGQWSVGATSTGNLGAVSTEILASNARAEVDFNAVDWDQATGQLRIDYLANDADSNAQVSFYISRNEDGSEAIFLGSADETGEMQDFTWNATAIPTGRYFVFAVLDDGTNAPQTSFSDFTVDIVNVGGYETLVAGTSEGDFFTNAAGQELFDGGGNVDVVRISGSLANYTLTQAALGVFTLENLDITDTFRGIEFLQFDDELFRLLPGTGVSVTFQTADPAVYQSAMNAIRDFGGNALGGNGSWLRIGEADVNGDGDIDQILVNDAIGRFATVGTAPDGLVYFSDHGWAGETRVAGIYIDPLVAAGVVVAGSDNDSQRRFQNDLEIENINRVLGADDYDNDGVQEVFFALTDGTAYLRALMHADGNIRYANYQSEQEVIDYLTANGFGAETWGDWFDAPSSGSASLAAEDSAAIRSGLPQLEAADTALPGGSGMAQIDLGQLGFGQPGFGAQFHLAAEEFIRTEFYG